MQLAFSLRQKLWLLIVPAIFYLLLLTIIVIQHHSQFSLMSISLVLATFSIIGLMLWVGSSLKQSVYLPTTCAVNSDKKSVEPSTIYASNVEPENSEIKSQHTNKYDKEEQLSQTPVKTESPESSVKLQLTNNQQRMIDELRLIFSALAIGDLEQTMTGEYIDDLAALKTDVNAVLNQLKIVNSEIINTTESVSKGILKQRISLENKQGFFKNISEKINQHLDINQQLIEDAIIMFKALSEGNLNQTMRAHYQGDLAELKTNVNKTVTHLNDAMLAFEQSSKLINSSSNNILQNNLSLSQHNQQQVTIIQEITTRIQKMTETAQQNAQNAEQANQLSINAYKEVEQVDQIVKQLVNATEEMNATNQKVLEAITIIDDIAFRINKLNLSIAIEFIRICDKSDNFAIREARDLTRYSAEMTKDIKILIKDNSFKIDENVTLVEQLNKNLQQTVFSANQANDSVGKVATLNCEQSEGILQINNTMTQLDILTQENTNLIKQLSDNSENMHKQIISLTNCAEIKTLFYNPSLTNDDKSNLSA